MRDKRDKAAAESAVNTVNKRVIGYLAEEEWTGLAELNEAIAERVHEVNHELWIAPGLVEGLIQRKDADHASFEEVSR